MFRFLLIAGIATTTLVAQNLSRRWVGTVNDAETPERIYLSLQQGGVDLFGTVTYGGEVFLIERAVINKNKATFETRDTSDHVAAFEVTLGDDRLLGQVNVGGRVLPLSLSQLTPDEHVFVLSIEADEHGRVTIITVDHSLGKPIELATRKLVLCLSRLNFRSAYSDGHHVPIEVILPQ
jgi:hypothetical protein